MFEEYLVRWQLEVDGRDIETPTSRLLPVRFRGEPAMLKVALCDEERLGAGLMLAWNGAGAARVLGWHGPALLLERGGASLVEQPDDEATRVICALAARLHQAHAPDLVELETWFGDCPVPEQREIVPLHGDLHHGNVLHFGGRGWLAIDPKGLRGDRAFDYVNMLRNPSAEVALAPGRFTRQVDLICACAGLERERLLQWTYAFAQLSVSWEGSQLDRAMMELSARELLRSR